MKGDPIRGSEAGARWKARLPSHRVSSRSVRLRRRCQQESCHFLFALIIILLVSVSPFTLAFRPTFPTRQPSLLATSTCLSAATSSSTSSWYPKTSALYDDDIFAQNDAATKLEERAVQITAHLIRNRLQQDNDDTNKENAPPSPVLNNNELKEQTLSLVKGRFHDLTCTLKGELELERLFWQDVSTLEYLWDQATDVASGTGFTPADVVLASVMVVQSLCAMGTQVGVKGAPEQLRRMKAHLEPAFVSKKNGSGGVDDPEVWNNESIRRLKYNLDRTPALQLVAELQWKKTPQSVFDLLVQLGAWEKHEDLALLRSGFPIRFTESEEQAADEALERVNNNDLDIDPDTLMGLRQDLRHHKVYTIDSVSTSEIDDGLSVEVVESVDENGETKEKHRIWIHIADADRWAPRNSELFAAARRRITSLYLPRGSISMFPTKVATEVMSLKVNQDVCALSLGVELNDDGSIDQSSLIVTPSLIRVDYRLSYDDVDEMLEEGIGYSEEWQLGALLVAATKRREFRVRHGSLEGVVPNPVPYGSV